MHKFNAKCVKNIKEIQKEHKIFKSIKIIAKNTWSCQIAFCEFAYV